MFAHCKRSGLYPVISCDKLDVKGGCYVAVYRVQLEGAESGFGMAIGEPEKALHNALARALSAAGHNEFPELPETAVCPIGRYKGISIEELPETFVAHWANQERTGGELDRWIAACQEALAEKQQGA
jgi:uncharacterized protein (DUF3820 family)